MSGSGFYDPEKPAQDKTKSWNCKAHGCPLPLGIDELCRFHFGTDAGNWNQITIVLRANDSLLKAINWARTDAQSMSHQGQNEYLKRIETKYPELAPKENETAKQWAYRADSWLTQKGGQKDHATEYAKLKMVAEKSGFPLKAGEYLDYPVREGV
jgi:hypothetical protein